MSNPQESAEVARLSKAIDRLAGAVIATLPNNYDKPEFIAAYGEFLTARSDQEPDWPIEAPVG